MIFKSFSKLWIAFFQGKLSPEQLRDAPKLQFNCTEEHLLPSEETQGQLGRTFPMEVSWVDGMPSYYTQRIPETIVPSTIAIHFKEFQAIVKWLVSQGRVTFDQPSDSASPHLMWSQYCKDWPGVPVNWSLAPVKRGHQLYYGRYLGRALDVLFSLSYQDWRVEVAWRHPEDGEQVSWVSPDDVRVFHP